MKTVIIWGAGQGGKMVGNLLNSDINIAAYCDINEAKWGTAVDSIPIISPDDIASYAPDIVFISMLNKDACASAKQQLQNMGIEAPVITAVDLRDTFDLRLSALKMLAQEVKDRSIDGALAELGVYQGAFAAEMNRLFPDRKLYLFDTFSGFDQRDVDIEQEQRFSRATTENFTDTTIEMVRQRLPFPEQAIFKAGYFPETAAGIDDHFAIVSLDADLYKPLYKGLKFFYPRLSRGGCLIIHDYNNSRFSGAKQAVRQFCEEENVFVVPLSDLHGTAIISKG
ncbi:TylF/MycF/NovP-related O-methyltransferase [Desulfovibrio inopinatus]|uniref:TylF/MycF/NovP-related O-methyltransferase n=1 Tax=Desulfovibrio inopinatus TaxID=102109 RepID=UPI0003FC8D55|nr:TylF/MycF/NovP-related O-methyltransferase [Desulfovibrio inopinatus]